MIASAFDNHSEGTLLYQTKTSVNETFQEENNRNQISKIEENERYSFLFNFIHFFKILFAEIKIKDSKILKLKNG